MSQKHTKYLTAVIEIPNVMSLGVNRFQTELILNTSIVVYRSLIIKQRTGTVII